MALDELLMHWQLKGDFLPTLRFYEWETPTLTIGHFQKVERNINLNFIKDNNISFVRRQTGGRAVLHNNELTYSVTLKESYPNMPSDITSAYRVISMGLLQGYKNLNLSATFAVPDTKLQEAIKTAVCFDTPSMYEIVVQGKKIAGSAQVRKNGIILQHGSVPLSMDVDLLYNLFLFPSEKLKQRMKKDFINKATCIGEFVGSHVKVSDLISPFYKGFEGGLNINLIPYTLTKKEEEQVIQLAKDKYESDAWNMKL